MYKVYVIRNIDNGKAYVGASPSDSWWDAHRDSLRLQRKVQSPLQIDLREYGESKFTRQVVAEVDREEANEQRARLIDLLGTLAPAGYNLTQYGIDNEVWLEGLDSKVSWSFSCDLREYDVEVNREIHDEFGNRDDARAWNYITQ